MSFTSCTCSKDLLCCWQMIAKMLVPTVEVNITIQSMNIHQGHSYQWKRGTKLHRDQRLRGAQNDVLWGARTTPSPKWSWFWVGTIAKLVQGARIRSDTTDPAIILVWRTSANDSNLGSLKIHACSTVSATPILQYVPHCMFCGSFKSEMSSEWR